MKRGDSFQNVAGCERDQSGIFKKIEATKILFFISKSNVTGGYRKCRIQGFGHNSAQ
jgi:hypothetical protein